MCEACGYCCTHILWPCPEDEDFLRWLSLHGIATERLKSGLYARFDVPCKMLDGEKCSIYEQRPVMCRAAGCRGLVYSRPGYGRSTPRAVEEAWGLDFMHRQALEVLPALLAALGAVFLAVPALALAVAAMVVLLTLSNTVQNAIIGNDVSITGGLIGAATLLAMDSEITVRNAWAKPASCVGSKRTLSS